jgi:hypothetical protein
MISHETPNLRMLTVTGPIRRIETARQPGDRAANLWVSRIFG